MVNFIEQIFINLNGWGLIALSLILGVSEFALGLYGKKWSKNEKLLDIACYTLPKLVIGPVVAYFGLKVLPIILPDAKDSLTWIPFAFGALIIAIYDDLTQYWYHRLHHQLPFLWRFHRTHHSAPYMRFL